MKGQMQLFGVEKVQAQVQLSAQSIEPIEVFIQRRRQSSIFSRTA
jgi:hypothetical protein